MSYGFRANGAARSRRQPKAGEDIMAVLQRALSADKPTSVQALRGRMPRSGLPAALNERMPVPQRNGELTPDQIYAIGLQAVMAMRENEEGKFFDGGAVFKFLGKCRTSR